MKRRVPDLPHPVQPVYRDDDGTIRFMGNAIVRFLLDSSLFDLNKLAMLPFTEKDRDHFAQLIGYSVEGFAELSYASDASIREADALVRSMQHYEQLMSSVFGTLDTPDISAKVDAGAKSMKVVTIRLDSTADCDSDLYSSIVKAVGDLDTVGAVHDIEITEVQS